MDAADVLSEYTEKMDRPRSGPTVGVHSFMLKIGSRRAAVVSGRIEAAHKTAGQFLRGTGKVGQSRTFNESKYLVFNRKKLITLYIQVGLMCALRVHSA